MKKIITKSAIVLGTLLPFVTFAADKDLNYVIKIVIGYLGSAVYLILALAVVMFIWNVYKYFIAGGDEANRTEAGKYVMWSVIGFFVILSIWGLVNILLNTTKLNTDVPSTGIFGIFKSSQSSSPFNLPVTNYTGTNSSYPQPTY
jgi:hypothetical protein